MNKKGTLLGNINQAASVHADRGRRAEESPSPVRKKAVKVSVFPTPSRGSGLSFSITREKIKLVLAKRILLRDNIFLLLLIILCLQ